MLTTALISLGILFVFIFAGMPVAFALGITAFGGLIINTGFNGALTQLSLVPFTSVGNYTMSVIPLFILMGNLAFVSGLTEKAYSTGYAWLGSFRGGLAMATISACGFFAACTGSSVASIGTMATAALPEMRRYNYDNRLASGSVAAGTTLGILIPPSGPMIIYGLLASASIGKLFIGGILPGIMLMVLFMILISVMCRLNPSIGPKGPSTTWHQKIASIPSALPVLLLSGMVLGGIWGGIFTATEAGAIGAFLAFIIALVKRRLALGNLVDVLYNTIKASSMIFLMLIGAMLFVHYFAVTGIAQSLAEWVGTLPVPPLVILSAILFIYLIGGCIMDTAGMMMVTLPIFIPLVNALGIDLILFGILTTIMMEMALVTPPIGLNVFILAGIEKRIPMAETFKGVLPFVGVMIIGVILIIIFPEIVLFLPGMM